MPNGGDGRFSDYPSCDVIEPPAAVDLDPYYEKYLNCGGIAVVGSSNVSDEALLATNETLEWMLTDADDIREQLIDKGVYYVLTGTGETIGDLPELAGVPGVSYQGYSYELPSRGIHLSASTMDNVMCEPDNVAPGENNVVHEFAHSIHWAALDFLDDTFDSELRAAYNATRNTVWSNTYAGTAYEEYWAEGVAVWYGVNSYGPAGGNGTHNEINTRAELEEADPTLYELIARHMHPGIDIPGCTPPNVVVPDTECEASVEDIDGNSYDVVAIGSQCWLQQNLKTTQFRDGSAIEEVSDALDWAGTDAAARTSYNNDMALFDSYGALYNWAAVVDERGLCPEGWHVPTRLDWERLVGQLGGPLVAGGKMKTPGTTVWLEPNADATNESGFTGLPGGDYTYDNALVSFSGLTNTTTFWSSTPREGDEVYVRYLFWNNGDLWETQLDRRSGLYVRCIAD